MEPNNPIEAVAHRDPYPYYDRLLAGPPLTRDDGLRLWIAADAATLREIFASTDCHVRPTAEPVPSAIIGSAAGAVFGNLVRMNDGERHRKPKIALERALACMPAVKIDARARHLARTRMPTTVDPSALSNWMVETPVRVVADLLGFREDEGQEVVAAVQDFAACLSPLSSPAQLHAASVAASDLRTRMAVLLRATQPQTGTVAELVQAEAAALGWSDDGALLANLVGLLSQTLEATAGLIGNAIVALHSQVGLLDAVRAAPDGWAQLVHETSRFDSPVQNTRRFVASGTRIAGVDLAPGAIVLLVLGAANRDPHANRQPGEFILDRPDRCVFSFSRGDHACPGQAMARTIAAAALAVLFDAAPGDLLERLSWSYRGSTNGRLPIFHSPQGSEAHP